MADKQDDPFLSDEDQLLFREAMKDVRPIRQTSYKPAAPRPKPHVKRHTNVTETRQASFRDPTHPEDLPGTDELFYAKGGIQQRTLKKLRRGQFPVEARLDLHGFRVDEARQAVADFLAQARMARLQCVSIIHGKGLGSNGSFAILKKMVNFWLPQQKDVLAFCSAQARDGGKGAVYVLIKITD